MDGFTAAVTVKLAPWRERRAGVLRAAATHGATTGVPENARNSCLNLLLHLANEVLEFPVDGVTWRPVVLARP